MARLDLQRPPSRGHARTTARKYWRGYATIPHGIWGNPGGSPVTAASAGTPGAFSPSTGTLPASPAALAANDPVRVTATPATAWTTGQYVQTATAGAAGRASWSGTDWVSGAAP